MNICKKNTCQASSNVKRLCRHIIHGSDSHNESSDLFHELGHRREKIPAHLQKKYRQIEGKEFGHHVSQTQIKKKASLVGIPTFRSSIIIFLYEKSTGSESSALIYVWLLTNISLSGID